MIDSAPYFYDPSTGYTAWKKGGGWQVTRGNIWYMNRQTVDWEAPSLELIERFEDLCVSV